MNQRVSMVRNGRAVAWSALWAAALLISAVALFIGFGARQASAAGTASYTITDLGNLSGNYSVAQGINDDGHVVGYADVAGPTDEHATLYENGQMQDLGTLGGGRSFAYAINNIGQVVGGAGTGSGSDHAFLYENGQMNDLGTLGGAYSYARGINDQGQVAGFSYIGNDYSNDERAFLYENGQMKNLGTLPGGKTSRAYAVNNNGQVVGENRTNSDIVHAFLYENGQMNDLGTLGGTYSTAQDINDQGQVVGYAGATGSDQTHAFVYENGQMRDLGTLPGDPNGATLAYSINNNGQVVGTAYPETSPNGAAFLYENGQVKDLNSLIPQGSGWTLFNAFGINNNGQIVGGGSYNGDGGTHAFLLTPKTSVDSASQSVAAGGTVSTSTGDGTASPSDPVNTSITTPMDGTVTINETSVSQPETTGFSFFGQQINIEAPQASVQNPLSLKFVVDSSLMPSGTDHNTMQLFRDGVRIEACDSGASATTASPDPCVKQRSQLPDGDASITVLSSHASAWNLGVAQAGTPLYSFKGFFQPVDKLPTINSVKAGAAVPVRFSLGGDRGLDIFAAGYPISGRTPIDPSASLDAIEQTVTASSSGLSYSTGTGQYTYTWKTDKGWAGQTRQLVLRLKDGTEHKATFKLTK
jgi:probable HAF family extracellular repeat protein